MSANRTPLLCKGCNTIQEKLSEHLRRVCMKNSSAEDVRLALDEAKSNAKKIVRSLSVVSYEELDYQMSSFVDPQDFFKDFLQSRGCQIIGTPERPQPREEVQEEVGESSQACGVEQPKELRKKLREAGLYHRHGTDKEEMKCFDDFMKKNFNHSNLKQTVDSVGRFLYFTNDEEIDLQFIFHPDMIKSYVQAHQEKHTSVATIKNYLNDINIFCNFILSDEFPKPLDESTRQAVKVYQCGLRNMREGLTEKAEKSKERRSLAPVDCRRLLNHTQKQADSVFEKAKKGETLSDQQKMFVVNFLEAMLMLKYLHKPTTLQNLKVQDWLQRSSVDQRNQSFTVFKTGNQKIVLERKDEELFTVYFSHIRPTLPHKETDSGGCFLMLSSGQALKNPSSDLSRFHIKSQLPAVTGKEARDSFEQWSRCHLPEEDRERTAALLKHLDGKAPITNLAMVEAVSILINLKSSQDDRAPPEKRRRVEGEGGEEGAAGPSSSVHVKEQMFQNLLHDYPIHITSQVPSLSSCQQVCGILAHYIQRRWRSEQNHLRLFEVIEGLRSAPTPQAVENFCQTQGWDTNLPKFEDIKRLWKPRPSKSQAKTSISSFIEEHVESQQWKGLVVMDDPSKGGYALKTSQPFKTGDIICDYHAILMDGEEGEEKQSHISEGNCYLFFFRDKGKKMCFDATQAPCSCHPMMTTTFGRMINHSCGKANVKPVLKHLEDGSPVLIFIAIKDIPPGTELLCHYGVG